MLQNAKFYLVNNISKEFSYNHMLNFEEPAKIIPLTTDEVNNKATRNLEVRLAEQLPQAQWGLKVNFIDFTVGITHSQASIQAGSVVVSGEVLKRLHSIVLYNATNARLKMKMSSEFCIQSEVVDRYNSESMITTTVQHEAELLLRIDAQGCVSYTDTNTTNSGRKASVKAEGLPSSKINLAYRHTVQLKSFSVWRILESGLYSDVTIIAKDKSAIPCHKIVLIGQSAVMETMLKEKVYVEGQTGEISMVDRSEEEVKSFLAFLYYADLQKTLTDTELAVTLSEMGHYYDVKGLENGIKPVLLSRPAQSFGVDAALRLFNVACGLNDLDLKRKAADVLETRSNEEVFKSPLFNGFSAAVVRDLFAMSRRMF